jgi:hypothetical protein
MVSLCNLKVFKGKKRRRKDGGLSFVGIRKREQSDSETTGKFKGNFRKIAGISSEFLIYYLSR